MCVRRFGRSDAPPKHWPWASHRCIYDPRYAFALRLRSAPFALYVSHSTSCTGAAYVGSFVNLMRDSGFWSFPRGRGLLDGGKRVDFCRHVHAS